MKEKIFYGDAETVACCQMNRVFGYNPRLGNKLIEAAGGVEEIFKMGRQKLSQILGSQPPAGLDTAGLEQSAKELENLATQGSYFLGITANAYPALLKECEDPPIGLYIKSDSPPEDIFRERPYIGVVGTRDISHYGIDWCRKITAALCTSQQMPSIVSGLALGTDIIAHRTALDSGCPTIAVMATGVDMVYPKMHVFDADRIAATPGSALVSDYPPGTSPIAGNFIRRNRIIAGLSSATILVESRIKGGGMSTAYMACSYNRDVFALPGKADDIRSGGCNKLIAEHKAELILTPEDLLGKLGLCTRRGHKGLRDMPLKLPEGLYPPEEKEALEALLRIIRHSRGVSKMELCKKTGMEVPQISGLLSILESEGLIFTDLLGNCSARNNFQ